MRTLTTLQRSIVATVIVGLFALAPPAQADETGKVTSLRLEKGVNSSTYVIEQSGNGGYQEFLLNNPRRLVLDIVGARHALDEYIYDGDGGLVKGIRTSQYTNDPDEVTRIVFDLADATLYKVSRLGENVEVRFFTDGTAAKAPEIMEASWDSDVEPKAAAASKPVSTDSAKKSADGSVEKAQPEASAPEKAAAAPQKVAPKKATPEKAAPAQSAWSAAAKSASPTPAVAKPAAKSVDVAQSNPWSGQRTRTYPAEMSAYTVASQTSMRNSEITMDIQGADIRTVLRSISEFSGVNIVAGPEVEGAVTVHLVKVPWAEALDVILKANGYGIRQEYGIYRVGTLDKLHDEELDIAMVAQKKEDLTPMITRVIELSFTNAREMQSAMSKVTTKRGNISVEKGSNALIINDIPKVVERIAAMIHSLDKKTQQVEIVAKMVDVDVEATREIGVQWDFMNIMSSDVNGNLNAFSGDPLTDPFGGLRIGTVQSWGAVMATIEALERENKADIISNPRITTADNHEAFILVGKEIPLIVSDEAGNPITELKKIGVTLRVTPHVNADRTITLDLHPEISELSSQATVQGGLIISLQEASTRVLVGDGETAVIGGLIQEVETTLESGIPGLKDVPLIGGLFKFKSTTKKKRELIIFVTPRIVDLSGGNDTGMNN
ncbi:MAG: AMIN domain-containing protein [Candidatus Krumholzibacteriota bacterium]|nr:AMIN domain-containing protein [Candidatus Krumholzibacteriota bacterium]